MKANELRIGNCILFESEGTNFIVKAIDDKGFEVYNQLESTWIEHDQFGGIPLTEEWLFKFGFHYRNEHRGHGSILDLDHEDWKKSLALAKLQNPDYKGYCALATGRQDIVYVHQLQNLYFALTGNELKINA